MVDVLKLTAVLAELPNDRTRLLDNLDQSFKVTGQEADEDKPGEARD